jgi:hypothetical protein
MKINKTIYKYSDFYSEKQYTLYRDNEYQYPIMSIAICTFFKPIKKKFITFKFKI